MLFNIHMLHLPLGVCSPLFLLENQVEIMPYMRFLLFWMDNDGGSCRVRLRLYIAYKVNEGELQDSPNSKVTRMKKINPCKTFTHKRELT